MTAMHAGYLVAHVHRFCMELVHAYGLNRLSLSSYYPDLSAHVHFLILTQDPNVRVYFPGAAAGGMILSQTGRLSEHRSVMYSECEYARVCS